MITGFAALRPWGRIEDAPAGTASVSQLRRALWRDRRWIAIPAVAALALSSVFVMVATPRYLGEAKVLLESRDSFFTRPGQERIDIQPSIDEQAVASQVQVVMSRDLAREAIRRLNLVGNPEFDPLVDEMGPWQRLMVLIGAAKNPLDRPPEDRVLERYFDRLQVFPVGKSRILAIEFRSFDPELAARGANTIADLYLEFQEAAKKDTARSASTWLGTSIDALRDRVTQAEAKVEEFRAKNGLLIGTNNSVISSQQLADLTTQLAQAKSAQSESQAKAQLIRDMIKEGRVFDISDVSNNELIRRLVEQRISLRAQLALEERTLLSAHPRIKELNAQLRDLESQVRSAADRVVRTLENDAKIAGARVAALQATLDSQKTTVASANTSEVQLRALEREAKAQREQLESYLARWREATARDVDNAVPPDARIISRAIVPQEPVFPKPLPIIAFATLATLVFAMGAVVTRELLASTPEADPRLRRVFGRAWPAAFGRSAPKPLPLVAAGPDQSERYELARLIERLARIDASGRGRRVVVAGLDRPHAASDLALAIGRALGETWPTLLVASDVDAEAGAAKPGFADLLAGKARFDEVIGRDTESNLHIIAAGRPAEAEGAARWADLGLALGAFEQTYDWVILALRDASGDDLAPFASRADSVVIASELDASDPALIKLYDRAKLAGAPDVIVARERAQAEAALS